MDSVILKTLSLHSVSDQPTRIKGWGELQLPSNTP